MILLFWASSSCTPKPPDVPVCEALTQRLATDPATGHVILSPSPTCELKIQEPECGHCVYIVSGNEVFVGNEPAHWFNGKTWTLLKQQSIMLPAQESYAPLAAYIIDSCHHAGCDKSADKFSATLGKLGAKP